jgi:hypothetical protein
MERLGLIRKEITGITGGLSTVEYVSTLPMEEQAQAIEELRGLWDQYLTLGGETYQKSSIEYQRIYAKTLTELINLQDYVKVFAKKFGVDIEQLAEGGDFAGGYRVVGEHGPEIEYTGPSTILNNQKSKTLMSDNVILLSEFRKLREETKVGNYQIAKNTGKLAKIIDRFDSDGLPDTRTI